MPDYTPAQLLVAIITLLSPVLLELVRPRGLVRELLREKKKKPEKRDQSAIRFNYQGLWTLVALGCALSALVLLLLPHGKSRTMEFDVFHYAKTDGFVSGYVEAATNKATTIHGSIGDTTNSMVTVAADAADRELEKKVYYTSISFPVKSGQWWLVHAGGEKPAKNVLFWTPLSRR